LIYLTEMAFWHIGVTCFLIVMRDLSGIEHFKGTMFPRASRVDLSGLTWRFRRRPERE
jgi:hypothetical protein